MFLLPLRKNAKIQTYRVKCHRKGAEKMFEIGDYISYENIGVVKVLDITMIDMPGADRKRNYYILGPVYEEHRTIYCPVDNDKVRMRKILTKDETDSLLSEIDGFEMLEVKDKRQLENICKAALQSTDCKQWIRLFKTLVKERNTSIEHGKKVTTVNERYLRIVQDRICGEFAVALGKGKSEIEALLAQKV